MKTQNYLSLLIIGLFLLTGCAIAPVATSFDSARLVKPKNVAGALTYSSYSVEVPHYSYNYNSVNGTISQNESTTRETTNNNYGAQIIIGGEKSNFGFHFEKLVAPGGEGVLNYFSIEPKFRLSENRSAFSIPVGIYFTGEGGALLQLTPTFFFTFGDEKYFEFNLSPKALIFLDNSVMFNLSAGIGLSTDLSKWAIRPEIGYTINTASNSISGIMHIGAGLSFSFGK